MSERENEEAEEEKEEEEEEEMGKSLLTPTAIETKEEWKMRGG